MRQQMVMHGHLAHVSTSARVDWHPLRTFAAISHSVRGITGWIRRMRRVGSMILVGSITLTLAACGLADSRSPVPGFMRAKETDPVPPESAPDVGAVVSKEVDVVFVPTSHPHDVQVSQPHRDLRSSGWVACVRAELTSATG